MIILFAGCGYKYRMRQEVRRLAPNPPGTVRIYDSLYADRFEVSVLSWREFIAWIEQKDSANRYNREENLPDSLVWYEVDPRMNSEIYFTHPGFNNYPMVGITYEQAEAFCRWRSDMVNNAKASGKNPEWKFRKIRYRLPTREEWEMLAANRLNPDEFPHGLPLPKEKIGDLIYYRWHRYERPNYGPRIYPVEIRALYPNSFGVYNIMGNVSEMIAEKGVAKGGNFLVSLDSVRVKLDLPYSRPEAWLGFRCVCDILE
jgi:formylglycine-generating enzyme required for sulfatase activity